MSVKSSARIKKRRSAEAAAATASTVTGSGSFAAIGSQQRLGLSAGGSSSNNNTSLGSSNNNATSNGNQQQQINKKHNFVGRNPNFDTDETKLLIQLWGDPKLQRTLITTHKKHAVICQLAAKMQEYGYHRSPEEITTRIKNLKCFYNRLKKDKECGLTGETEPSWKHFAEMDAIMTRPIFSVRPNEVPAPSLKYQLEQALEEHAERRKRRQENGEEMTDSDNEEDDMLLSSLVPNGKNKRDAPVNEGNADVQLDMDASEETFVVHAGDKRAAAKRRKLSSEPELDVDETAAKETPRIKTEQQEPATESTTTVTATTTGATASTATVAAPTAAATEVEEDDDCMLLPLPKEEPIDVDAVDEANELPPNTATTAAAPATRGVMPTLADMLQLPKATNLLPFSGANVIIPANSISNSIAQLNSTVSTSNSKLTAGKISLVPTNFLMQPKPTSNATAASKGVSVGTASGTQLQLLQSAINQGARLMISGAAPTPVQAAANTGLVTGPGGVKFVLVNAEQAAAAKVAATVKTSAGTVATAASLPHPQQQQPQQQTKLLQPSEYNQQLVQQQQQQQAVQQTPAQPQQQQQEKKEEKRRAQEKAREEQLSKRHMTTMRIMLRQLLNAQNEANEIQHNRLSLERERLDWEKSMGERIITLLPSLLQPAAAAASVATANAVQPTATHQSPQFIVSGTAAGTAGQRLQPPKLLFTTALPMTNGTVSMPHILTPSSALATSLPKVIAAPAPSSSSSSAAGSTSAGATGGGSIIAKPVEICTQINDIQLITPKLEKEG
ncbi:AF4/FMR2 family member lilli [Drosophila nasuta]|uniref:AF4/FMR2 family member lilli n=1 Tax=Drosophila nasuta TaxID=42062 RepID=UPI00295E4D78|nr:AF4/FMR2 family member lilli [Drosophila nasuta]XP_060659620.1 AF4/FMR2 family member lilli [Drosophila nasuta]